MPDDDHPNASTPTGETPTALVRRARKINRILSVVYPDAACELTFSNPFQLLVSTILSAQCTDQRVNAVTPQLFEAYPTPHDFAEADIPDVETMIKPTGFFRAKAKNIVTMSQQLCREFDGNVPGRMEDLTGLAGVGRKTANVVLGNAFDVPGLAVDTHVGRLSRRLGWSNSDDPVVVERDLQKLFPSREWTMVSHRLIFHGRRCCRARSPMCAQCPIAALCPASTAAVKWRLKKRRTTT